MVSGASAQPGQYLAWMPEVGTCLAGSKACDVHGMGCLVWAEHVGWVAGRVAAAHGAPSATGCGWRWCARACAGAASDCHTKPNVPRLPTVLAPLFGRKPTHALTLPVRRPHPTPSPPAADLHQGGELPAPPAHAVHAGGGPQGRGDPRRGGQQHQEGGGEQGGQKAAGGEVQERQEPLVLQQAQVGAAASGSLLLCWRCEGGGACGATAARGRAAE